MKSTSRDKQQTNGSATAILRSFASRIVRLKGEIKELQGDIKDVKNEAAAQGFDKKALDIVVARMMEDETQRSSRQETEAVAELYLANLGMLDGTPLGDATRRRMEPEPEPEAAEDAPEGEEMPPAGSPPAGAMSQEQIDAARAEGKEAALEGRKVFANPYVAGDPRRAAWDEGWCQATGSDGMDIPEAWRRKAKKPPADGAAPAQG